jgi:hypothetical protein
MIRSIVWDTLHNVNLQGCVKQVPTDDGEHRHTRRFFKSGFFCVFSHSHQSLKMSALGLLCKKCYDQCNIMTVVPK